MMIQIENLTKYYGLNKAIENLNFTVNQGEVVGFLGPNAAGKTTTLRIITGYFPPTSGKVTIKDYDIMEHPMEAKALIGYMPENPPLYTDMTVKSFLNFAGKIRSIPKKKFKEAFIRAVEQSGLTNHLKSIIGHLSKGYKQRVALAQALLHDPEILILDEPTAGHDAKERIDLLNIIKEFIGKKTVILSTHILADVEKVCNRVIIIHKGKIVAEGSYEMLSSNITGNERFAITIQRNESQLEKELSQINGIYKITQSQDNPKRFIIESIPDPNIKENVTILCVEKNFGLIELSPSRLPLEEIFITLTKE